MKIDTAVLPVDLLPTIRRMWEVSGAKIVSIDRTMDRSKGARVHTVAGQYRPRGWTDWTQGFEFGSAILQFDATGDQQFLALGLDRIRLRPWLFRCDRVNNRPWAVVSER